MSGNIDWTLIVMASQKAQSAAEASLAFRPAAGLHDLRQHTAALSNWTSPTRQRTRHVTPPFAPRTGRISLVAGLARRPSWGRLKGGRP